MTDCELCNFNNPKGTVTAVIFKNNKILVFKRLEAPYEGMWDLPGGFMDKYEKPEQALEREMLEELGSRIKYTKIGNFPGTSIFKGNTFYITSHTFLVELLDDIKFDISENSEMKWVDPAELDILAFDSNNDILRFVKDNFVINFDELNNLIKQLDPSAEVKEYNYYRSILNGYCSKKYVDGRLVGVGWIFPRQTYLRKQAVIEDVVVDSSERGKGFGEAITLDLMRWA